MENLYSIINIQPTKIILYGKDKQYIFRDPFTIGEELFKYLKDRPKIPNGINLNKSNSLTEWLNKL